MYEESRSRIDGAVLWNSAHLDTVTTNVVPDGCMDLIWSDGALIVSGPDLEARSVVSEGQGRSIGLRLPPGLAPLLFRVSAADLTGRVIDLAALAGDGPTRRLADALAAGRASVPLTGHLGRFKVPGAPEGPGSVLDGPGAILERFVAELSPAGADALHRPGALHRSDPLLAVPGLLRRGLPVAQVADTLGYSARHLQRRSREAFGYGAKTLDAILRFQRAAELMSTGVPLAAAAATAGYADQSHLSRSFSRFAGVAPSRWLSARLIRLRDVSARHRDRAGDQLA